MYRCFCLLALLVLTACGGGESVWAPDDVVAKATYRHSGPKRLTLFTMINNSSGAGAHTALMINGSQRVIWDPAGSFAHEKVPERNDVVIGVSPSVLAFYKSYHARKTFRLRIQELDVSAKIAERTLDAALANGPVPDALCANSTSMILSQIFPDKIHPTLSPLNLSQQFAGLGANSREVYEYDSDDNRGVLTDWVPPKN